MLSMNERIKKLTADKVVSRAIWVSLAAFIVTVIYLAFSYFKLPPFVPLFNQAPWGDARLAAKLFLLLPLLLTCGVYIINILVSSIIYEKIPLLSRMLIITMFLISILVLVYYFRTIHLII